MAEDTKTVDLEVDGTKFSVKVVSKNGKVFAESNVEGFGAISVPDFGGGESQALKEIRARLSVIARDVKSQIKQEAE